ncbi:uracil-DNA glycosylase [Achromobacter spanius]|uniref:uracil-DNA glycosylase n=1 Tax=Achromobacter spanius TaxID=217203 RepID=UPI0032095066
MSPQDAAQRPAPPRVNPLQRVWLREIGMERLWLRPAPGPAPGRAAIAPADAVRPTAPVAAVEPVAPMPPPAAVAEAPAAVAVVPPAAAPAERAVVSAEPVSARAAAIPASIRNRTGPPPPPAPKVEALADEAPPPIPVAEAVKDASLQQMAELVVACAACGLCRGRRHAVFGQGAQPTRWLVVGEAPGEQEDRQGLPFVGRSGQLLDAMLAAVGMSRERDVFITNVIKCRPPGNRNPKPEEIAACSPYLMRQIALLKPERILVLGRFAAQTLLGTDATIGSLRGRVHQLKTDEGAQIPVIVSYHPAYLLRSPSEKARAWQDLKLAARAL